jgi:hypothetical protein
MDAYRRLWCHPVVESIRSRERISCSNIIHLPGRAEERVAKLVDSPDRPESEASYKLDEGGWTDV